MLVDTTNVGPISSVVFTFIGFKQTDTDRDKQDIYKTHTYKMFGN